MSAEALVIELRSVRSGTTLVEWGDPAEVREDPGDPILLMPRTGPVIFV